MFKKISLGLILVLSGCASTGDYEKYLNAQTEANKQAAANRKPLVKIVAQEGQPITGLQSVEVYAPESAPVIQQARPNEWAGVVDRALGVVGTAIGLKIGTSGAIGLVKEVGQAANHGYSFVNPTPVIAPDPVQIPTQVIDKPVVVELPTQVIEPVIVDPVVITPSGQ